MIRELREVQIQLGIKEPLKPIENPMRRKFLEGRLEELLPEENFYFYKEGRYISDLVRLIDDCKKSKSFYVKEGIFKPN